MSSITEITGIKRDVLYINESKMKSLAKNIEKQLDIISSSLRNLCTKLDFFINREAITDKHLDVCKTLLVKSREQADATDKLITELQDKYNIDLQQYSIHLLDERIAELEKKIAVLMNQ